MTTAATIRCEKCDAEILPHHCRYRIGGQFVCGGCTVDLRLVLDDSRLRRAADDVRARFSAAVPFAARPNGTVEAPLVKGGCGRTDASAVRASSVFGWALVGLAALALSVLFWKWFFGA